MKYLPYIKIRVEVTIDPTKKTPLYHLTLAYLIGNEPVLVCITCNETLSIEHIGSNQLPQIH